MLGSLAGWPCAAGRLHSPSLPFAARKWRPRQALKFMIVASLAAIAGSWSVHCRIKAEAARYSFDGASDLQSSCNAALSYRNPLEPSPRPASLRRAIQTCVCPSNSRPCSKREFSVLSSHANFRRLQELQPEFNQDFLLDWHQTEIEDWYRFGKVRQAREKLSETLMMSLFTRVKRKGSWQSKAGNSIRNPAPNA